jgi:arylsulfatase
VIWLVDTLRADHLSCYGYERQTSPQLDALAAEGVLFEQAHVHTNWTQPSVASLYSGRYPPTFSEEFDSSVPDGLTLLPEWLGARGWATAGYTVTVATAARFGFDQGYDTYEELDWRLPFRDRKRRDGPTFHAATVVDAALGWLDRRRDPGQRFLLTLHSVDPHLPYQSHPELPSFTGAYDGPFDGSAASFGGLRRAGHVFDEADRRQIVDLYDDEVRYNDSQLGRLRRELEARGLGEDVLLVVVSDHGEELFERGEHGHGHGNLHAELSHVPLVMHWPAGLAGGVRVGPLVRAIDLVPTLCDLAGVPLPEPLDGVSLAGLARGDVARRADAEVLLDRAKADIDPMALRTATDLLCVNKKGEASYYDLRADPDAVDERAASHVGRVADLREHLQAWHLARVYLSQTLRAGEQAVALDEETRAALEALGYLGGDGR